MVHPLVRRTCLRDIRHVAANMRQADRNEVTAASGKTPFQALLEGFAGTPLCYSFVPEDDRAVAVGGVLAHPIHTGVGICWLLGTDEIHKHRRVFLRDSVKVIEEVSRGFHCITNLVDVRNTLHLRWLKWCGFQMRETYLIGPDSSPFIKCERYTQNV